MNAATAPVDARATAEAPLLRLEDIHKSFGPNEVLHGIDFEVRRGEVHAILGENGAGKSTLMNILAGVYADYEGRCRLDGRELRFSSPAEAEAHGVVMFHQERQVIEELSVAENICLGRLPARRGLVRWKRVREEADEALAEIGVDLDPGRRVAQLNASEVALIAIVRALHRRPRVLIMDEPTAALGPREIAALFRAVRRFKDDGGTVLYISHHLSEVFEIADRVTVLRDGAVVHHTTSAETSAEELVQAMVGEALRDEERQTRARGEGRPLLEVSNLATPSGVRDVSLMIRAGETVALAGLVSARRAETALAIFGADPWRGKMLLNGETYAPRSPADAIRRGVVYLSEDRASTGLLLEARVEDNLTLTRLPRARRGLRLDMRRLRGVVDRLLSALRIVPPDPQRIVAELSGGNQQKVALGKSLLEDAQLLLLDEPTRGVDVGAKAEIHRIIAEQPGEGRAVLLISSEPLEVRALADRVYVLHRGTVVAELSGDEVTEQAILEAATQGAAA